MAMCGCALNPACSGGGICTVQWMSQAPWRSCSRSTMETQDIQEGYSTVVNLPHTHTHTSCMVCFGVYAHRVAIDQISHSVTELKHPD